MKGTGRKAGHRASMMLALLIGFMLIAPMTAVLADIEPNDDFSTAEPISSGAVVVGDLDEFSDTYDYYSIWLDSGDTLYVSMTGTGDDFDLDLYGPSEFYITGSSGAYSTESITYTATSSGTYYIVPYAWSGSGTYTLTASVTQGGSGGGGDTGGDTGGNYYVGGDPYVEGQPKAELPTLTVGNGVYWGGVKDLGKEYQDQIKEGLAEIEDMGYDVNVDVSGGVGAYFGLEVASDDTDINGNTCYDIAINGALGIDFGLDASVKGSSTIYGSTMSIDGSGNGFIKGEAELTGHLYLTVDELAVAKLQLTFTADAEMEAHIDATVSAQGQTNKVNADIEASVDSVRIDFNLEFDPPLDIYQFPIWEGKEWYVPGTDTYVSGSLNAQGTISYDVSAAVPYEEPVSESDTINLATEIGDNDFSDTIPGGQPDWGWGDGGLLFTCVYANDNIFIIETGLGNAFGFVELPEFPGTRQFDLSGYEDMLPSTGMQYDASQGMVTGMTVDGEVITEPVTSGDVSSFADDPLGTVTSETGGYSGGSGLLGLLLIVVIVVVVLVVVVALVTRKKKTPPPQSYGPQPYQQPPPPPAEYPQQPPQGGYPPEGGAPPGGNVPPPPPPPPGQ